MKTPYKILLAPLAAAIASAPLPARAQFDIDPPLPNVLLLVDTSGSMEYLIAPDPVTGKNQLPGSVAGSACVAGTPPNVMNRWATLISVLTGQINNFSCEATRRNNAFSAEYSFLGTKPYDLGYYLPFHRLLSNNCTPGPGVEPTNYWDWPNGAIKYHDISGVNVACAAPWSQATDGVLDTFRDRVRFGMMTFDTFTDAGVGTSGNQPDGGTGIKGMWSYYPGWTTGSGNYKQGHPPACTPTSFEVGARNQAAPPWEGRLIPFGPGDGTLLDMQTTNDHIQEALIAMRPYGATPVDGMLDDAREFLLNDTNTDPSTGKPFGPAGDPYVQGGCRKSFMILLSDGEPNLDLRPDCAQAGGNCPYPDAADVTANQLASLSGNGQILTYVVGLGVSNPSALTPLGLTSCTDLDPAVHCAAPSPGLKSCCALTRIAAAGGTGHAYFADDPVGLKALLSGILAAITSNSTARTVPVFAGVSTTAAQGSASAAGYRFIARFKADPSGKLWSGALERERYVCTPQNGKLQASLQTPKISSGDDFGANLNTNSPTRRFFTFAAPPLSGGSIRSDLTLRPNITTDDGLGTYGTGTAGMSFQDGASFATTLAANTQLLGIDPLNPPQACSTTLNATSASSCVNLLVRWHVGEVNPSLPDTRDSSACSVSGACSEFGSVYHSTPAVVGPPQDTIPDESYTTFALQNATRPIMLYTATTDGQLHAFKVAASDPSDSLKVDSQANNELWSFMPPIVLPKLLSAYNQQALLTDGAPVTADVVFDRKRLQPATWHTVLVAGGGTAGGFYYALDITDPQKPKFLWQLSNDTSNRPLFGRTTTRPAIATVALPDGSDLKEVAVAILPGGTSSLLAGSCARDNTGSLMKSSQFSPRSSVHCWAATPAARSLTIVRLDTGEVLMNFRGAASDGPPGLVANSKIVNFSSPITGIPVAYPAQTGQVSDRIYVGDADGALWRIDLSSTDPTKWTAKLAWDAYPLSGDNDQTGEMVKTAPVVATNPIGDTVIVYSTGDQDLLTPSATMDTRLWSLVEKRNAVGSTYDIKENFYKQFLGGERITGPMALFASVLYFSSFAPVSSGAACSYGGSAVWAIDYQTAAARFPDPQNPTVFKAFEPAPNTIIFGVALTQTPTCADTTCSNDAFFGTNCYYNSASGGGYEIVWQKGPGNGVTTNTLVKTGSDGIQSLGVQSPQQSTRIDSWAGIIE
jgi:type IV pilus assembly protein PilY1